MNAQPLSVLIVGAGEFALAHARGVLAMGDAVRIAAFVDPAQKAREDAASMYAERKLDNVPPFYNSIEEFLTANQGPADCAIVASPHSFHAPHAIACMRAGMDTLLEKPMVLNIAEARRVIRVRDATGRFLSVAFPGSYSPAVRKARELIAAGEIGRVMSIVLLTHQRWLEKNIGTWRMVPEISGNGFLFDTGSHAVNTMLEIIESDISELAALADNRGAPLNISSAIAGRFENGALFTICTEGNTLDYAARLTIYGTSGILATGSWGGHLRITRPGQKEEAVPCDPNPNTFAEFLRARAGEIPNPCPAEIGLRFAKFMDMVQTSAAQGRVKRSRK